MVGLKSLFDRADFLTVKLQSLILLRRQLPARPYTSCQDYLIWLLVMLETSSILCEGEVARFNSMNLKGHLKP